MITVVEWQDDNREFNLQTAFCVNSTDVAKEHFISALENSSNECPTPYISLTIYSDNGMNYIDGDIFKTVKSALEWWEETCFN